MILIDPNLFKVSLVLDLADLQEQGIGAFLVKKAEMIASELGYDRLYLFTPDKATWYTKLGWHTFFNKVPVTVMEKAFSVLN